MAKGHKRLKFVPLFIIGAGLAGMAYLGRDPYRAVATIQELLAENRTLKQAISNLSGESQIGYAKVIAQQTKDGQLYTTLKFVETARDDKLKKILEKEFTIAGDVIHFDALIVKFGNKMVMDGRIRSLYLWRRVYGEQMTPQEYETSWAKDPYDSDYHAVDRSVLRFVSDDECYDERFPEHPLSKVRRILTALPSSIHAEPPGEEA